MYLARSEPTHESPGVADYYGIYREGKAKNALQTLDTEEENITLVQLKDCLKQFFEAETNTDDTCHKWQNIHQTAVDQPACIMNIAGQLVEHKGLLQIGFISDYGQQQPFLNSIDYRLGYNGEPQHRPEDTWYHMVAVAECDNVSMYRTGGYKGSDTSQASNHESNTPKKETTNCKLSKKSPFRNQDNGKASAKKRSYTQSNKQSKSEIDRSKVAGACFYRQRERADGK